MALLCVHIAGLHYQNGKDRPLSSSKNGECAACSTKSAFTMRDSTPLMLHKTFLLDVPVFRYCNKWRVDQDKDNDQISIRTIRWCADISSKFNVQKLITQNCQSQSYTSYGVRWWDKRLLNVLNFFIIMVTEGVESIFVSCLHKSCKRASKQIVKFLEQLMS